MSLPNTVPQVTLQGTSSKGLFCLQRTLLPPKNTPFGFLFACFSYPVVGHSCSSWLPGAFWGALIPLVKFWSCMDLTHSVDSFNLPMPHQSGLEITAEVSNKCITSAVRMKKEENQSVVSFLREDRAAGGGGGSWANRLLTMLILLDLGRDFGGPGYSRAILSAVPMQGLSHKRADLTVNVLLELYVHGSGSLRAMWYRAHGELVPGMSLWLSSAGCQLQQLPELGLGSGWKSVLPWEAQGGQCVLPGSELAVTPCSRPRMELPLPQKNCPSTGIPSPPLALILQNPEFLCSAEHPWLLPAAPVPSPAFC